METDLISETECAKAHIEGDPEVHKSDIDIEPVFGYQDITDDIDQQSRNAEPDQDICFAQKKEASESNNQQQNDAVDHICEFAYPGKIQCAALL